MAEATQYRFDLTEVATLLVKAQGLQEGKWMVSLDIGFSAAVMGASPETSYPTAMIQMPSISLVVAPDMLPGTPGIVDAAIVNPKPTKSTKT